MGFIFYNILFLISWVSSDFLRSRIRLGSLEQIQEEGRRWFRKNGAQSRPPSRPKWSSISAFAPISASVSAKMELNLGLCPGLGLRLGQNEARSRPLPGNLRKLKIFILHSNGFCGAIVGPNFNITFYELRIFDISCNNLTGCLQTSSKI
ncbi:hypothetical protein CFP56_020773 [Quercus suber]|uniref:Uncharacterized protein n=1 Tax=Quercus suber TaxID=58331 RepID=A0AAW0KGV7_QUESU